MQGAPPTIIGGESALGELTFQIPEDFDPWLSEIMVGALGDHRAVVPLAGEGDVARLAPSAPDVGGVASTDLVDLDFTGAVLRYDDPLTYSQLADGTRGLTLYFDVTSRVDGRRELTPDHFTLVLADGSEVSVAAAELGRIEGSEEGMTTTDRYVSFVVDAELDGALAVRFAPSEDFLLEDGLAEALFEFSL